MRKIYILFFIISLSCKRERERIVYDYDDQGNFTSSVLIIEKDTIRRIKYIKDTLSVDLNEKFVQFGDTLYEKHKNGNIFLKIVPLERYYVYFEKYDSKGYKTYSGFIRNNKKINIWKYYKNNKLKRENFYIENKDSTYVTEDIIYNLDGSINEKESDYIDWKLPDTLMIGKSIGDVKFKRVWNNSIQNFFCVGYGINNKFDNLLKAKIDTFPYPTEDNQFDGFIIVKFDKLGKQILRGFIYETQLNESDKNIVRVEVSHRFFEKEFFIISRPDSIPKDKAINYNRQDH